MANFNYSDLYILYNGHPMYNDVSVIEDDLVRTILQKYEMILFTNKGEMYGDTEFGADILLYLYQTKVSAAYVKKEIISQIDTYIPELSAISYSLDVTFQANPSDFSDMMFISFKISEFEVNNFFGA